ncbi:hypothetical protein WN944_015955 [Citrus x changshan-huyou]|uniref:Uncharacterized protein n=1 Tax=Citrus x changshan-huyou TaxID=2935761 RepID=A0AAP0MAR0_9ROSI
MVDLIVTNRREVRKEKLTGKDARPTVERMDKAAKCGVFHASQDAAGCRRLMTAKCTERGEAGQQALNLRRQKRVLSSGEAFGVR